MPDRAAPAAARPPAPDPVRVHRGRVLLIVAIAFAAYHVYTAGFGTPAEHEHMGVHLAGLFILIFASFPFIRTQSALTYRGSSWLRPGNIPLYDWGFALIGVSAGLFLTLSWTGVTIFGYEVPEQALRQGEPSLPDIILGTGLVVLVLEIARRTIGIILPLILLAVVAAAVAD